MRSLNLFPNDKACIRSQAWTKALRLVVWSGLRQFFKTSSFATDNSLSSVECRASCTFVLTHTSPTRQACGFDWNTISTVTLYLLCSKTNHARKYRQQVSVPTDSPTASMLPAAPWDPFYKGSEEKRDWNGKYIQFPPRCEARWCWWYDVDWKNWVSVGIWFWQMVAAYIRSFFLFGGILNAKDRYLIAWLYEALPSRWVRILGSIPRPSAHVCPSETG